MEERVRLVRHKSAYVLPTESLAQFDEDLNGVTKALKPQNRTNGFILTVLPTRTGKCNVTGERRRRL